MQIIIDIPNVLYERAKKPPTLGIYEEIIAKGIPLPKGHGRLKDIDKIISDGRSKGFCDWYDEMKYADTIIEAEGSDKE